MREKFDVDSLEKKTHWLDHFLKKNIDIGPLEMETYQEDLFVKNSTLIPWKKRHKKSHSYIINSLIFSLMPFL